MHLNSKEEHTMKTKKFGKWIMTGLIVAAMVAPLPVLAAHGRGPQRNTQVEQTRPNCPNREQRLHDGSGRTQKSSLHQNRRIGLKDGMGKRFNHGAGMRHGTGNRGPKQS